MGGGSSRGARRLGGVQPPIRLVNPAVDCSAFALQGMSAADFKRLSERPEHQPPAKGSRGTPAPAADGGAPGGEVNERAFWSGVTNSPPLYGADTPVRIAQAPQTCSLSSAQPAFRDAPACWRRRLACWLACLLACSRRSPFPSQEGAGLRSPGHAAACMGAALLGSARTHPPCRRPPPPAHAGVAV